jgi:hypothetical protein
MRNIFNFFHFTILCILKVKLWQGPILSIYLLLEIEFIPIPYPFCVFLNAGHRTICETLALRYIKWYISISLLSYKLKKKNTVDNFLCGGCNFHNAVQFTGVDENRKRKVSFFH